MRGGGFSSFPPLPYRLLSDFRSLTSEVTSQSPLATDSGLFLIAPIDKISSFPTMPSRRIFMANLMAKNEYYHNHLQGQINDLQRDLCELRDLCRPLIQANLAACIADLKAQQTWITDLSSPTYKEISQQIINLQTALAHL